MAFFTQEQEVQLGALGTKAAHGFTIGQGIRADGSDFLLAQANTPANCATFLGIVTEVLSVDAFKYALPGELLGAVGTYTAGLTYYVSDATPGLITSVQPGGQSVYLPVGQATPEGQLIMGAYLGLEAVQSSGQVASPLKLEIPTAGAHGLAVGDAIRSTATGYTKAQANNGPNSDSYVGIVVDVISPTVFTLGLPGARFGAGFTGGAVYYLSAATAGAITATQPTTPNFVLPVGVGLPSGELLLVQYIGVPA
jgi:hypothetical protein